MAPPHWLGEIRILVISPMRIYREGLSHVLAQETAIRISGMASDLEEAVPLLRTAPVDVVLLDISVDPNLDGLKRLSRNGGLRVLAIGVLEHEDQVIACAEAGIAGYVTPSGSLNDLVQTIRDAARGEFNCPPRIAACLLRRLAAVGAEGRQVQPPPRLTMRELEIVRLIDRGLSNKEIAKQLSIQPATVKNHVHNILEKLDVRRRTDAVARLRSHRALDRAGPVAASSRI
jgi:two-component system, NarL family, nitrate/nitrite response regulator NarL